MSAAQDKEQLPQVTSGGGCLSPECLGLISHGSALLGKGKLHLHKRQVLETLFNTEEHVKLAKSFSAARGGNPISTCSSQPLLFVYTSVIHVIMQKESKKFQSLETNVDLFILPGELSLGSAP